MDKLIPLNNQNVSANVVFTRIDDYNVDLSVSFTLPSSTFISNSPSGPNGNDNTQTVIGDGTLDIANTKLTVTHDGNNTTIELSGTTGAKRPGTGEF